MAIFRDSYTILRIHVGILRGPRLESPEVLCSGTVSLRTANPLRASAGDLS